MTDKRYDELRVMILSVLAAIVAMVVWAGGVRLVEELTGTDDGMALRIGLLFLAVFGGNRIVRVIGDTIYPTRQRRRKGDLDDDSTH